MEPKSLLSVDYGWKNWAYAVLKYDVNLQLLSITPYLPTPILPDNVPSEACMVDDTITGALVGIWFKVHTIPQTDELVIERPPHGIATCGAHALVGAITAVHAYRNVSKIEKYYRCSDRTSVMRTFGMQLGRGHLSSKTQSMEKVRTLFPDCEPKVAENDHICDAILQGLHTWRHFWQYQPEVRLVLNSVCTDGQHETT